MVRSLTENQTTGQFIQQPREGVSISVGTHRSLPMFDIEINPLNDKAHGKYGCMLIIGNLTDGNGTYSNAWQSNGGSGSLAHQNPFTILTVIAFVAMFASWFYY